MRSIFAAIALLIATTTVAQKSNLTIDMIMEGEEFVGSLPTLSHWSENSKQLYFYWNRDSQGQDSLYSYSVESGDVVMEMSERPVDFIYSGDSKRYLYIESGDLFVSSKDGKESIQVTNSVEQESDPFWGGDGSKIYYRIGDNLYCWSIETGATSQLTNFISVSGEDKVEMSAQDKWLKDDQLSMMEVLNKRVADKRESSDFSKSREVSRPKSIYLNGESLNNIGISGDGESILYSCYKREERHSTDVPNYVTEDSYTKNIEARGNVGAAYGCSSIYIYSTIQDSVISLSLDNLKGLYDKPAYFKEYQELNSREEKRRDITLNNVAWSSNREQVVLTLRANDNKDIWIALVNLKDGTVTELDRQHDDAWVSGPGIGRVLGWLSDNRRVYYQSEATGYSHLYTVNVETGEKSQITSGEFEVYNPQLSKSGEEFFYLSNEGDSGVRNLYSITTEGDDKRELTNRDGKVEALLSPDEEWVAALCSESNTPTELFIGEKSKKGVELTQVTHSTTEKFQSYSWREPEIVNIPTADGNYAKARLYKPSVESSNSKAVVFVHGAGYLQNAHQWWSSYYREYMFHNFLTDNGYTVLDIDYRGSAGYGRNWRTGIYRHMGGKDLSDNIDGAKYLAKEHNIDETKIGIYGGSYGGFITLMALFNSDDFAAGAALRSVTDWSHYNHGYTSNILNTPLLDPKAYRRSSPIYFAEGLNEPLLICHGMVDDNVHFQDVVRLSQRLIELRKEDWEMAIYPMERHGFVEPSSWADEYRRIFKQFEEM